MKKLYLTVIIITATQMTLTKNNHYPLLGRLPEDNTVKVNCENLHPAFFYLLKDSLETACDSLEDRLAEVAKNRGYADRGFAFSHDFILRLIPGKITRKMTDAAHENQDSIKTIIGLGTLAKEPELKKKAEKELQALAKKLCDEHEDNLFKSN